MRSGQKPASANHSAAEADRGPMGSEQKPCSGGRDNGLPISLLLDSWAPAPKAQEFLKKIVGWTQTELTTRIFITGLCWPGPNTASLRVAIIGSRAEKNILLRFEIGA